MGSDNKGEQLSKASLPLQVCMSVRASGMPFAQDSTYLFWAIYFWNKEG